MASYHTRSLSFPAKSHPVAEQLDQQLCRLRSSQAASTSSLTNKLTILKDIYNCVDEFLQLPKNLNTQLVEEVLDGSLRLVDICATSQDILVQSKEHLQDVQSVLRRKCNGELNMTNELVLYLQSRKSSKKIIKKCLKDIKQVEKSNEANVIESMLKDVQTLTSDVFKSLLSYIGGSQKSSWSFSKMVRHQSEKEIAAAISKFDAVDATLELMATQKKKANVDIKHVVELESEVEEIDQVLECLFRNLVKTRVTLLNAVSN